MTSDPTSATRPRPLSETPGLLARAPIASLVVDGDGVVCWYNRAAAALLALPDQTEDAAGGRIDLGSLFPDTSSTSIIAQTRTMLERDAPPATRLSATLRRSERGNTAVDVHLGPLDDHLVLVQMVEPAPTAATTLAASQRLLFESLVSLSEMARDHVDPDEFHQALLQRVVEVVPGAEAGSVLIRRPGTDVFDFVAAEGYDLAALRTISLTTDELTCELDGGGARIVDPTTSVPLPERTAEVLTSAGRVGEIAVTLSVPVLVDGVAAAFLNVDSFSDPRAFDHHGLEMATVLSRLIADLITRRTMEQDLREVGESYRHLAHHDELTGLPNRRRIEEAMMDVAAASFGSGQSMAVLFADLDGFKAVNDTYGHDAGDFVLQTIAARLGRATRTRDVVGRWGGDEFVVVAPDVESVEAAQHLAERILEQCPPEIDLGDGTVVTCAMSIGVAWSSNERDGLWAMLRRADDALYQAKGDGRGVVRVHGRH